MPLYIRDDGVRALADQLATQRKCTVTQAVREALEQALRSEDAEFERRLKAMDEILAEFDAAPQLRPGFTDRDLYDAAGNPVL